MAHGEVPLERQDDVGEDGAAEGHVVDRVQKVHEQLEETEVSESSWYNIRIHKHEHLFLQARPWLRAVHKQNISKKSFFAIIL